MKQKDLFLNFQEEKIRAEEGFSDEKARKHDSQVNNVNFVLFFLDKTLITIKI